MVEVIPIPKNWDKDKHNRLVIQNLVLNYGIGKVAEIGVFKGRTMRAVLRSDAGSGIEQWFAVDPWLADQRLYSDQGDQETWDAMYKGVCKYMPWFPALRVVRLKSLDAAPLFLKQSLDMVYIDGDHSPEAVEADIRAWRDKVRSGGIMAGHDFVEGGAVTDIYNVAKGVRAVFGDDFVLTKCSVWYRVME